MFDGLLKSKFYSKCKTGLKLTKTRIELIKRKRNATQKYFKNDIADLLKNALDYNAYGRAEGLLVELNLSSCYDFVEQYCACILSHLSAMNKQRECPEECREAVPSLMFAAARFADLPELRTLRSLFAEKYGNSLDPYVNKELVNKLKSAPPTKDMKLQLLQDIALEYGMEWDCKALEQKLYRPPAAAQQDFFKNANNDVDIEVQKSINENVGKTTHQHVAKERDQENLHPRGRKAVPTDDDNIPSEGAQVANNDKGSAVVKDRSHLGYRSIPPPPYTKSKVSKNETSLDVPIASPRREEKTGIKKNDHIDHREEENNQGEPVNKPKPVPKSVRRRRSTNTSGKKQEGDDKRDEEEKIMDKLLKHYSSKPSEEPGPVEDPASIKLKQRDGVRARTNSFPGEATNSTTSTEDTNGHARAASFHHDVVDGPKLLDYDDFVARLAALRGKAKE